MDVYFDNLQIIHYTNPLTEVNDYYPFGLLAKTSTSLGGTLQNYKYNGKELQRDLSFNVLDYGARQYDPVSGRWLQVDPLAEKYRRFSPYSYVGDNPIRFIDPDGMQWGIFFSLGAAEYAIPKAVLETTTKTAEVIGKTSEVTAKTSETNKPIGGDILKVLSKAETKAAQPKYKAGTETPKDIPKFSAPNMDLPIINLSKGVAAGTIAYYVYELYQSTKELIKIPLKIPKEEEKKPTEVKPQKK